MAAASLKQKRSLYRLALKDRRTPMEDLTLYRQVCIVILHMSTKRRSPSAAKQRILDTADRLFYQDGIRAVGIDRIIAQAKVAKMTLYAYFPSKDALIVAVLAYREEKVLAFFHAAMEQHAKRTTDKVGAFFGALQEWFEAPGFRGCAFQNAAVELADPAHAGTRFVRDHKRRFGELLRSLVEEAVGKGAAKVAPAIALLVEGAIVTAVIQGTPEAAQIAHAAALKLIEGATGK